MKIPNINSPDDFLHMRGLSVDVAVYTRTMMEILQRLRNVRHIVVDNEVASSIGDLIEYIENEMRYIRHIDGE